MSKTHNPIMFSEWKYLQRHQRGVMMEGCCRTSYSEQEQESSDLEPTKASKLLLLKEAVLRGLLGGLWKGHSSSLFKYFLNRCLICSMDSVLSLVYFMSHLK